MAFMAPADLVRKLPLEAIMGRGGGVDAIRFWEQYRQHRPDHPIFLDLECDLSMVFPYALHGDEGAGLAEAGIAASSRMCAHCGSCGFCALCPARCPRWS